MWSCPSPPRPSLLGGTLAQAPAVFETGAAATGTTTFTIGDTIPTNTAGDQYMSQAITPTNASSTLYIDVVWNGSISISGTVFVGLFQDATANALAATVQSNSTAG